jgi:hypothetical protein
VYDCAMASRKMRAATACCEQQNRTLTQGTRRAAPTSHASASCTSSVALGYGFSSMWALHTHQPALSYALASPYGRAQADHGMCQLSYSQQLVEHSAMLPQEDAVSAQYACRCDSRPAEMLIDAPLVQR